MKEDLLKVFGSIMISFEVKAVFPLGSSRVIVLFLKRAVYFPDMSSLPFIRKVLTVSKQALLTFSIRPTEIKGSVL